MPNLPRKTLFLLLLSLALNGLLLGHCHNRTWAPSDDGYFAHVAERLVEGEVLNRDIQSRHGGYVHFIHAGAFSLFGKTLVSLRYPLLFLSMLQAAILYFLFLPQGVFFAFLASLLINAFGYVHYLSPMTHWYCLFLMILIAASLRLPRENFFRIPWIGFLLGLLFLFRQLTGIFVAMALILYLFWERSSAENKRGFFPSYILSLIAGALIFYLMRYGDTLAFILFGIGPCFLIFLGLKQIRLRSRAAAILLIQMAFGIFMAALPLLIYHLHYGSLALWWEDAAVRAGSMIEKTSYQSWSTYALYMGKGLMQLLSPSSPTTVLNGLYWIVLPLIPLINGLLLSWTLLKKKILEKEEAFALLAVFYSLVSHMLQTHYFLYYSLGLSFIGSLALLKKYFASLYRPAVSATVFLTALSVLFHAGQTHERGFAGTLEGRTPPLYKSSQLPKAGVKMPVEISRKFEGLVQIIHKHTAAEDAIFVLPNNPEIYFLSGRRNAFRFDFLPTALQNENDLLEIVEEAQKQRPRLMIYHRGDKYENALTVQLRETLEKDYQLLTDFEEFGIYLLEARKPEFK